MWLQPVMESRCEEQWRNKRSKEGLGWINGRHQGRSLPAYPCREGKAPAAGSRNGSLMGLYLPQGPAVEGERGRTGASSFSCQVEAGRSVCDCLSRQPADALRALWLSCMDVSISTGCNKPLVSLLCLIPAEYQANVYSM